MLLSPELLHPYLSIESACKFFFLFFRPTQAKNIRTNANSALYFFLACRSLVNFRVHVGKTWGEFN